METLNILLKEVITILDGITYTPQVTNTDNVKGEIVVKIEIKKDAVIVFNNSWIKLWALRLDNNNSLLITNSKILDNYRRVKANYESGIDIIDNLITKYENLKTLEEDYVFSTSTIKIYGWIFQDLKGYKIDLNSDEPLPKKLTKNRFIKLA